MNVLKSYCQFIVCPFFIVFFSYTCQGQIVWLEPTGAGPNEAVTLFFDASQGNADLALEDKIYVHHGVVTSSPSGTEWTNVVGNWGKDDGIGLMTKVVGQEKVWKYEFAPDLRSYFGLDSSTNIFRISCVFRSADGSKKAIITPGEYGWGSVAPNFDFYINLNNSQYLTITSPFKDSDFYDLGDQVTINVTASSPVSSFELYINNGSGEMLVAQTNTGQSLSYNYPTTSSTSLTIRAVAVINGETVSSTKTHQITLKKPNTIAVLPSGVIPGINYDAMDPTTVTLVLQAPNKEFVHLVGDFNDWIVSDGYQMNQSPDGEYFWLRLDNIESNKPYVFQYLIDGNIRVGDPYADQVADPYNDRFISNETFANIPEYNKESYGLATVFQTGQTPYNWAASELTWQRPNVDHLVIYELHIRDFIGTHNYQGLIDTLDYIQRLGVNAIELMPINEFEGNDSWGYNPSYFFAPDKYYGPKDDLKKFIETCHQRGIAVILDIVLNHAFGQNPMVRMYFDESTNTPSADNPWFNQEYVGQYQWGYDFNHESPYTQYFVDRVNDYWLSEYHFDGFRFDFTKGLTNNAPNGSIDGYDKDRINLLKRMGDAMWSKHPEAYMILEHWAPSQEENELAALGMKMWRNKSYDFIPATLGNPIGTFDGHQATSHVSFYNSHDERRIAEHALTEGLRANGYDVKDPITMYERMKLAAAFSYLMPGPKMIWQFDELGYDIDINFNGRTGRKPYPWGPNGLGYYEDPGRQNIYTAYKELLHLRNVITPEKMLNANSSNRLTGDIRRITYDTDSIDLVLIGNFSLKEGSIAGGFSETGTWYDYFKGDSLQVNTTFSTIDLKPGEWRIYTNYRLSEGFPGVVNIIENPVTISPNPFYDDEEITIIYDAEKGLKVGPNPDQWTNLDKVYIHMGVILRGETTPTKIRGTLTDDGIGLMEPFLGEKWRIKLTPRSYFDLAEDERIDRIVMYFRDADNSNQGYASTVDWISFKVLSRDPILSISPTVWQNDTDVTIVFDADQGNGELATADKIYMHSSVATINSNTPQNNAWGKVVGNWGQDDGIGAMTRIAGTNKWTITIKPGTYYNLSNDESPYWIAAVFRSKDGSLKGTAQPGPIENGFIHTNFDFFVQNQKVVHTQNQELLPISIWPNPADHSIHIDGVTPPYNIICTDMMGRKVLHKYQYQDTTLEVSTLSKGQYFIHIQKENRHASQPLIILR